VHEPGLVPRAIADALGVEEVGGDVMGPLRAHLSRRALLLLVDNFEQVDAAATVLSDLLTAAEGLRLLVTSRSRLHLYGEHVREVEPLELAAAVPLFCERARSVARWFDASATEAIAEVCEALDRVPLALELAAARCDDVSLSQMTAQLGSRLELAGAGPRDRDPRQRSLRSAIQWSIDLLAPAKAAVFGRLGVFVGGFDAEAAKAVAGAHAGDLEALVRASLLSAEHGRFRMLEVIREYALETLAPEAHEACAAAHAEWFEAVAVASVDGGRGKDRQVWHARLHAERGNMRVALEWLAEHARDDAPPGERLLRMAAALGIFWYRTNPTDDDVVWLEQALALARDAPAELRGRAHYALAICRAEQGRVDEALDHGRQAYASFGSGADPAWEARAVNTLAGLLRDLGRAAEAVPLMDHSIALRRRLEHPMLPPTLALANRAMAALDLGDAPTARRCLEECLSDDDETEVAMARRLLAEVALHTGDLREAREQLIAAIPILQRAEQRYRLIECLDTLAWLAVLCGREAEAAALLAAADRGLAEEGAHLVPADAALRQLRVAPALAAMDGEARAAAESRGAQLGVAEAVDLAVSWLLRG
jgi:predicted ATPase